MLGLRDDLRGTKHLSGTASHRRSSRRRRGVGGELRGVGGEIVNISLRSHGLRQADAEDAHRRVWTRGDRRAERAKTRAKKKKRRRQRDAAARRKAYNEVRGSRRSRGGIRAGVARYRRLMVLRFYTRMASLESELGTMVLCAIRLSPLSHCNHGHARVYE